MNHPNQHIINALFNKKKVQWTFITEHGNKVSGVLCNTVHSDHFIALLECSPQYTFMVMPDLIKIGGIEVVAPLKEAKNGQQIFVLEPDGVVMPVVYRGSTGDNKFIDNRSAFVTAEAATAFNKAMKAYLK